MKILHLTWSLKIGGKEYLIADLVNGFNTKNIELGLINNDSEPILINSINNSIPIHYFRREKKSKNPIFILYLYKYLIQNKPDIIHFHSSKLFYYLLPYKILFNKKFIVTVHGKGEQTNTTNRFDKVVFISKQLKNECLNVHQNKSIVIYNGVKVPKPKLTFVDERKNEKTYKILQIGRLNHFDKGQDILIKSFCAFLKKHSNSELHLIGEGESLDYLNKLVYDLQIEEKIKFLGVRSKEYIYNSLPKYHLMVQPSRNEGFGLTVVESMLLFTPVLVSSNTGSAEVIENGKYGYIFNNEDEVDCTRKIIEVWENWSKNNKIFKKLSKAQNFAEKSYSIVKMVDKYEKIYQELNN